jgi:hypothetical protein
MATDTKPRTPGTKTAAPQTPQTPRVRPTGKTTKTPSPRHTRPTAAPNGTQPRSRQPKDRYRQQRMPFILLLVGLLGGALVSLLVISTTLDEGSYDINNLTTQNNMLYKDVANLSNVVAQERNPAVIAQEAYNLGLRQQSDERFINPATSTITVVPAVEP